MRSLRNVVDDGVQATVENTDMLPLLTVRSRSPNIVGDFPARAPERSARG